jgi:Ca2+-binding RTX toxin-like protein
MSAARTAALAAALSACLAQAAPAATVGLDYEPPLPGIEPEAAYTLTFSDGAGESNRVAVTSDAGAYTVRDEGAPLTAGPGCEQIDAHEVGCPTPTRTAEHSVFADGGRGADVVSVRLHSTAIKVEVRGGRGGDFLTGGPGDDIIMGGSGDDWLAGQEGNDRLDGGAGDDRLDGGEGSDTVSYARRMAPVVADLVSATGGAAGERDTYAAVEDLTGGRGSDRLWGDDGPNTLLGGTGGGRDRVAGRGGDDQLIAHRADGGRGDDRIGARVFSCGAGNDVLYRTLTLVRGPFPANCEVVLSGAVFIRPDPVRRSRRRLVYAIKCLFDGVACAARLQVRDRRGPIGTTRFRLRAGPDGPFKRVTVRLERRPRSRVGQLHVRDQHRYDDDWFRTRLR